MAKITIFGLAGTGKSTVGKLVAEELGFKFASSGNMFRDKAASLGLSLYQFEELVNKNQQYDIDLDKEVEKYGTEHDNFVFEGRLAWYFIPDSFKVKLNCDFDIRVERVALRDRITFEEAKRQTDFREESIFKRYKETYGIDELGTDSSFNLVLDTSKLSIPEVVKAMKAAFLNKGA